VLFAIDNDAKPDADRFLPGRLAELLPAGTYRFANAPHDVRLAVLAVALGSTGLARYRTAETKDQAPNCPPASTAPTSPASPRA
jgi:leucyl aminopeptidase